ncbi:MAG: hypothetical protein HY064_02460 [Bacteroidetes bacterium]|nr:hypothetical protein [Bacteroidota bacterium]
MKFISFVEAEGGINLKHTPTADQYEFRFEVASAISDKEKKMTVIMTTTVLLKTGEKARVELGQLKALVVFNVVNLDEITIEIGGKKGVPEHLYILTYGITLSTSRGMLAIQVEKTKFNNAIIPVIDPKILVDGINKI